jgi:hypothetical protein
MPKLLFFGLFTVFFNLRADLTQRFIVGKAHNRYQQTIFNCHSNADVNVVIVSNFGSQPARVDVWIFA